MSLPVKKDEQYIYENKLRENARLIPGNYQPWVGFDLDGTLAEQKQGWQGVKIIGKPIPEIVETLKEELKISREKGYKVKIFTARACDFSAVFFIRKWLKENKLPDDLEITCQKDYGCRYIYDDRAVQIEKNTGKIIGKRLEVKENIMKVGEK